MCLMSMPGEEAVLAKKSYLRGKSDEALGEELNKLQSLSYEQLSSIIPKGLPPT